MSYNYLDKTGLASVWAKIKAALATKANSADLADIATSGSYEDLNDIPEILTTNDDVVTEDQVPYLFRKSPDSDRAVEEIVGGTVGWNQLCNNVSSSFTVLAGANKTLEIAKNISFVSGHKYLYAWRQNQTMSSNIRNGPSYYDGTIHYHPNIGTNARLAKDNYQWIFSPTNTTSSGGINYWCHTPDVDATYDNFILTDLTTMFGSTIADYIYSLEQSTAGAGVAKLKEWGFFTEDYYEYCEPTLKSVEGLQSKVTRDADENIIATYPLDSTLTLRGVPKLDSSNNLYYDGDVYPADGQGKRRYGVYVFDGTENFAMVSQTLSGVTYQYFQLYLENFTNKIANAKRKGMQFFTTHGYRNLYDLTYWYSGVTYGDKTAWTVSSTAGICFRDDSCQDATDFKQAIVGAILVYELATPTTFTAQPYHNPQIVGYTEEFVTTGLVPVGHRTKYHTSYYTTNDYIKEKGYLTEKDILGKVNTSDLATVATSGSYSDLGDTPTKVSDFENDAAYMSGMTILAYGKNNWTDFITAYTEQKVVYCRASSQSNPASGSQTRLAFMAYVNNADNPTEVEFQYYRSVSSHSNNQQGDQVYVYKLNKSNGWSVTVRESYTKVVAGIGLSGNWASGAITLSLNSSATATTSANGLMSSTDKSRLDELYADYSSALTALGVN